MGKDYELAVYSNKDFIWDKADLLVPRRRANKRFASSARSATSMATSQAFSRIIRTASRDSVLAVRGRRRRRAGRYQAFDAPSTGSRATTRTSTPSRGAFSAEPALHSERPRRGDTRSPRGWTWRHVRTHLVRHSRGSSVSGIGVSARGEGADQATSGVTSFVRKSTPAVRWRTSTSC